MRAFRYARDGLCLCACGVYAINRWLLPSAWKGPFLRDHFDDLLLIPAALPLLLGLQHLLGTRRREGPPTRTEILTVLVVWSVAAELVAPLLSRHAVGDPWDVAAYMIGAVGAALWWSRP